MHFLAERYLAAKRLDLSLPLCEQVLEKRKKKLGLDHPDTLATMGMPGSLAYGLVVPAAVR